MTVPDPSGQPDIERPIDITDVPGHDERAEPAPTPEHHPAEPGLPGDDGDESMADDPSVD